MTFGLGAGPRCDHRGYILHFPKNFFFESRWRCSFVIKWDEVVEGRFINLGEGGEWAKDCIEIDHTLRIRFMDSDHQACLDDDWDKIWEISYRKKLAEGHEVAQT